MNTINRTYTKQGITLQITAPATWLEKAHLMTIWTSVYKWLELFGWRRE